jgi:hypothetical protein
MRRGKLVHKRRLQVQIGWRVQQDRRVHRVCGNSHAADNGKRDEEFLFNVRRGRPAAAWRAVESGSDGRRVQDLGAVVDATVRVGV